MYPNISITQRQANLLREMIDHAREGAKLRPQCVGFYRILPGYGSEMYPEGATCFLGAVYEGSPIGERSNMPVYSEDSDDDNVSYFLHDKYYDVLFGVYPGMPDELGEEAELENISYNLENVVTSLNDTHRWTRERIADYLELVLNSATIIPERDYEDAITYL